MPLLDDQFAGTFWPMNAVDVLVEHLQIIGEHTPGTEDGVRVFPRPLDESAQSQSIGIYPNVRTPDDDSQEIGSREPTLKRYSIVIETNIKDADRVRALRLHGMLVGSVDHVLYRHEPLVRALHQLESTAYGVTTSYYRHGVGQQEYLTGMAGSTTVLRSATEFWIDTQTN